MHRVSIVCETRFFKNPTVTKLFCQSQFSNHNASVESVGGRIQSFQDITRILIIGITQVGSVEKNATFYFLPRFCLTAQAGCQNQVPQWIESRGDPIAELPLVGYCRRYFHLS
jgi:hypothetical protein